MINRERVQMLVDALRSGEFHQAQGQLRRRTPSGGTAYCCLGVATEIALRHGYVASGADAKDRPYPWDQGHQVMCPAVAEWYGFTDGNPDLKGLTPDGRRTTAHASRWNDTYGASLNQIADMFEATYLRTEVLL